MPVERGLHRLWAEGSVPQLVTYEGGNVDIFIGLTTPLAAWIGTRGPSRRPLALGWKVLGLLALLNIAVRSALTAPGAVQPDPCRCTEPGDRYVSLHVHRGLFAPLAVLLHALGLRALSASADRPIWRWSANEP